MNAKGRPSRPTGDSSRPVRKYRSTELIGDAPWAEIEHGRESYRLRITRLGKLILTK